MQAFWNKFAWDPIHEFNPAICFAPSMPGPGFYIVFVFNELRWEVIVRFVDIAGIVDHHGLKFIFIANIAFLLYVIWTVES
jgi:hypothetical protein